jgi:hypothetical protein
VRRDFHACPQSQNTVWKGLELTTKHNKTIHSHTQPSCSNASWTCCSNSAKPCAKLRESCNTFSQDLRKSAELMLSLSIRPPVLCKRILQRNKCPRENWQTHCRKHQCGMNCWLIRKTILQIELALGVCLFLNRIMNCKPLFMFKSSIAALRNLASFFVCLKDVDDAFISVHGN